MVTDPTRRRRVCLSVAVLLVATVLPVLPSAVAIAQPATTSGDPWTGDIGLPQPGVPNGPFADVSCSSATRCVAVGEEGYGNIPNALVEFWDGSSWSQVPNRDDVLVGGVSSRLSAVSCPASSSTCVGVGAYDDGQVLRPIVATVNPTGLWTAKLLPPPTGLAEATLSGVACTSASACVAVGSAGDLSAGTSAVPTAYRLQGSVWSNTAAPSAPSSRSHLTAVSCAKPRACTAIGRDDATTPSTPTAQTFDGTSWTPSTLAAISSTKAPVLRDVSCVAATVCSAVGSVTDPSSGLERPLVEVLASGVWKSAKVSVDPGSGGGLDSVSCTASTQCTAVGATDSTVSTTPHTPVVARRVASTWTAAVVHVTADESDSRFAGVSCATTTCTAVGATDGTPLAAASTDGGAWSDTDPVQPPLTSTPAHATGVSCASRTACMAVGYYETATGRDSLPFATNWDGTFFRLSFLPDVGHARLLAVSCATTSSCTGVGYTTSDTGAVAPLVLQWATSGWRRVNLPGGGAGVLTAVSCTSATSCLAVGQATPSGGNPLAVSRSGGGWSMTPAPPVGALHDTTLAGVSCVSGGCRVTGSGLDAGGNPQGIDLIWSGTTFSTGSTIGPSGAVSCVSITSCVSPSRLDATASVLTGTTWSTETLPAPTDGSVAGLGGVSCTGALHCVVAGSTSAHAGWVGVRTAGTWTAPGVQSPRPGDTELTDVSCPTDVFCLGVGQTWDLKRPFYVTS